MWLLWKIGWNISIVIKKSYRQRYFRIQSQKKTKNVGEWLESRLTSLFFKPEYDLAVADAFTSTGEYEMFSYMPTLF